MGKEDLKRARYKKILTENAIIREKWENIKLEKESQILKELEMNKNSGQINRFQAPSKYEKKWQMEEQFKNSLTTEEKWLNDFFTHFTTSKGINYDYTQIITKIIDERNIKPEEYLEKMRLGDRNYFWRLKNEVVELRTLVAFCIMFNVDNNALNSMLFALGLGIKRTDPVHYAYYKLVENYRGLSIYECNQLLKMVGITHKLDLLPDPLNCEEIIK